MLDWLIRGAQVLDGTGADAFPADDGIEDGTIAAVGRLTDADAARVLDAQGRALTPGFLDIHRHGDAAVFRPGFGRAELRQGLTSIVNGNCGLSLAPFGAAHRAELRRYLGAITGDIDPAIPTESMAAYLDDETIRPLCDKVTALAPDEVEYAITVKYWIAESDQRSVSEIQSRIAAAVAARHFDAAFVCTAPLTHAGNIGELLDAGLPVFTELNLVEDGYEENMALAREKGAARVLVLEQQGERLVDVP